MDRNALTQDSHLFDVDEVRRALAYLFPAEQVAELRALDATMAGDRWQQTIFGYFDDSEKLIEALPSIKSASGIYITLNPVDPALLARAANRLRKAGKGDPTADNNIVRRHWLPIDCDAQRPTGISSTDAEHQAALDCAARIRDELHFNYGWPEPILADSGNGGHLLYRIDLPVDDGGLIQRCLAALARKFDGAKVKIDQKVFNPARIWKLYGGLVCKGDHTADRPHRMARILSVSEGD